MLIESSSPEDITWEKNGATTVRILYSENKFETQPPETFCWNIVADYSLRDEYPMVYVSWDVAVAYAK